MIIIVTNKIEACFRRGLVVALPVTPNTLILATMYLYYNILRKAAPLGTKCR